MPKKIKIKVNEEELIEKACECLDKNYDGKYHHVAAAVLCGSKIYLGMNIDVIHGSCAEFTAIGAAVSAGEKKFDMIVAVGKNNGKNMIVAPCGNCRQMLLYLAPKIKVVVPCGKSYALATVKQLLASAYVDHR